MNEISVPRDSRVGHSRSRAHASDLAALPPTRVAPAHACFGVASRDGGSTVSSASVSDFSIETRSLPAFARRYHRDFTFYVAYPISSIFPSYFILPWREQTSPSKRQTDSVKKCGPTELYTRALLLLVVVSHLSEFLSVRTRPREPHDARLPVFRHSEHAPHHYLAGFRGYRIIDIVIDWIIGQQVERWAPFNLIWLAIEFSHPGPVDRLTILIHPIHRALYHVTLSWGVGDRSIFDCAGRKLRFAFVELPGAHEGIGSKGCCGCC